MGMLFVFTGLGLLLFIGAVAALIWSIRNGQLDDLDTPARRMLTDDASPKQDHHSKLPTAQTVAPLADDGQDASHRPPATSGTP